jgi:hypothetical protein
VFAGRYEALFSDGCSILARQHMLRAVQALTARAGGAVTFFTGRLTAQPDAVLVINRPEVSLMALQVAHLGGAARTLTDIQAVDPSPAVGSAEG